MQTYDETLNETYSLFKSQGLSVFGKGFEEIMSDPRLYEGWVASLTQDVSPDSKAQMAQLLANSNSELLSESTVAGIAPISSVYGPIIRKLWPAFGLKHAVKTDVADRPSFMINWTKPYYLTATPEGEEVKHYVPAELYDNDAKAFDLAGNYFTKKLAFSAKVTEGSSSIAVTDITDKESTVTAVDNGTLVYQFDTKVNTASLIKRQPLDADLTLMTVELSTGEVQVHAKLGIDNVLVADVPNFGTILLRADLAKATITVSAIKTVAGGAQIKAITVRAHRSTEFNEVVTSWGVDLEREDIRIGTGDHMVAPVTQESLKDMKAMYSLDGTKLCVDLMTNAFAYSVERQIIDFLKESFLKQPGRSLKGEFGDYPAASDYLAVFNVKGEAGFAQGPKAWREEIKPMIDHLAARIKNKTHLGAGSFKIVGNPLDIQIITNVQWKFHGGQQAVEGVDVNYSLGDYYSAGYVYNIVSTEVVPQGLIYIVFIPAGKEQLTYNYWAYSFTTEMGYRDPMHAMVPAVTMTKRDVLKSFMPAIAAIKIVGNDGNANYDPYRDYIPTKTSSSTEAEFDSVKATTTAGL